MGKSTTDWIVDIGTKGATKVLGGVSKPILGYHKAHFKLLGQALKVAHKDRKFQDATNKISKNIQRLVDLGAQILHKIPSKPEPPGVYDHNSTTDEEISQWKQDVKTFIVGVNEVRKVLGAYISEAKVVANETRRKLSKLESQLKYMEKNVGVSNTISSAARYRDIQLVLGVELPKLDRKLSDAQQRLKEYNNI